MNNNEQSGLEAVQSLLLDMTSDFIGHCEQDIHIWANKILELLGNFFNVDRSYIFFFSDDNKIMSNAYQWCANNVSPQIENLKDIPTNELPWATDRVLSAAHINIPSVKHLPKEAVAEKEHFLKQDIKSLLISPMIYKEKVIGFIGFDLVKSERYWTDRDEKLLCLTARLVTSTLKRSYAEEALKTNEQRYRLLAENSKDMIYRMALPDGKYEYVSSASKDIFGHTPKEFYNSPRLIQNVIHPDWRDYFQAQWDNLLAGDMPDYYEYKIIHKSGQQRWLHQRNTLIKSKNGAPIAIEGVVTDITDRVDNQKKLEDEKAFAEILLDSQLDTFFVFNSETGQPIRWNSAFREISGYCDEEIASLNAPVDLFDAEDQEKAALILRKLYDTGKATAQIALKTKSGRKIPHEYIASLLTDSQGNDIILSVGRDITERIKAEEALAKSELKYRRLFSSGYDAVFVHSFDDNGMPTKFLDVNDVACKRLGYSKEEFMELTPFDIDAPEMKPNMPVIMEKLHSDGHVVFEMVHVSRDGRRIPVEISGNLTYIDNSPLMISIARDISERLKAEAVKKQEADRLSSLLKLSHMGNLTEQEVMSYVLEECVRLTDSEVGYMHFYSKQSMELTLSLWSKSVLELCTAEKTAIYPLREAEIWADSVRTGKAAVHNDFPGTDGKKGYPDGHISLYRHMSIPVSVDDDLMIVIGVGNKKSLYEDNDINQVTLFLDSMLSIIDKHKSEKLIKEGQEHIRLLLESTAEGIYGIDTKGQCTFANPSCIKILGYKDESELIGKNMHDLIHHSAPDGSKYKEEDCHIYQAFRIGKDVRIDNEVLWRADGSCFPAEYLSRPMYKDGEVVGAVVTFIDITERKNAEAQVKAALETYSSMFHNNKSVMLLVDPETGAIVDANKQACEYYGYSKSRLLSMKISEINTLSEEAVYEELQNAKNDNRVFFEFRHQLANGDVRDVEVYSGPIEINGKDLLYSIIHDVTQKRLAIDKLKKREQQLRQSQKVAKIGSWNWDVADGTLEWSNETFRRFDKDPAAFKTSADYFLSVIHPDDREAVTKAMHDTLENDTPYHVQTRIINETGREWIMEAFGIVQRDKDGNPLRFAGTAQDITEKKLAEEELQKAQRLESIGLLAGGIAHDFNNLLTALLGNIELARMFTDKGSKAHDVLKRSKESYERARALTGQLLTFAKGGAPVKTLVSPSDILARTANLAFSGSNVKPEVSFSADLRNIEADEGQIQQVLNNIFINAQQSMPEGGIVRISADNVDIREREISTLLAGKYVAIRVIDSGVGMAMEEIQKIFDPYYTTKEFGRGLGLTIVHSIVTRHGGHVEARINDDCGSTFIVYLPASEKNIESDKPVEPEMLKGEGRILMMDDEAEVRAISREMLEVLGYKPSFSIHGEEAVSMYEKEFDAKHPFDAVILDLTIPGGMGGERTIRKLLEIDCNVKAIVASGYADDPVISGYADYGFRAALTKPFTIQELGEALHQAING